MQGYRSVQRANLARPGGTRSLLPQWFGSQPARRRQLLRPALRDRPHSQAENRSRQFLEYALTLPEDRTRRKWPGESPAIAISEITASAQYARSKTRLRIHRLEKLAVVLRITQFVEQKVDCVHRTHRVEDAAQDIHFLEDPSIGEQFFLTRSGPRDVDRREGALVGYLAVEDQFRVTGALEFFEDHFVHAAASIDQRRGDDGQRTTFLDIARGTEETLRPL